MFNIIREYIRQSKRIVEDKEFNEIYKDLEKDIIEIEKIRKETVVKVLKSYCLSLIMLVIFLILEQKTDIVIPHFINVIFIIFISYVIMKSVFEFIKNKKMYIDKYKTDILIKSIKKINQNIEYFPEQGIELNIYNEANFDEGIFDEYKSKDYIRINSKHIINISRVTLNQINYNDGKKEKYKTFDGIYCYVPINKKIQRIYLKKDRQNLIMKNGQLNLDSENFEKYFNVFSENRMLTMQVLTPAVMETINSFINECIINFEIVIQDDKIHFKFYTGPISPPEYFDLNYKHRMEINKRYIYYYYSIFKFIIKIIDYLSISLENLDI